MFNTKRNFSINYWLGKNYENILSLFIYEYCYHVTLHFRCGWKVMRLTILCTGAGSHFMWHRNFWFRRCINLNMIHLLCNCWECLKWSCMWCECIVKMDIEKFCAIKTASCETLQRVYGEHFLFKIQVFRWYKTFLDGWEEVEGKLHLRPSVSGNNVAFQCCYK